MNFVNLLINILIAYICAAKYEGFEFSQIYFLAFMAFMLIDIKRDQ